MARQTSLKSYVDAHTSSSSDSSSAYRSTSVSEASNIRDPLIEDYESAGSYSSADSDSVKSPPLQCPVKRRKKMDRRTFKDEWKVKYMMWPVNSSPATEAGATSTAKRHLQRKHPFSLTFSVDKRERLVRQFEHMYSKQRSTLTAALEPDKLVKLALYKLAFALGKHKLPYSCCESFIEFARAADPISSVFKLMAGSRDTVTRCSREMHQSILKPNTIHAIHFGHAWQMNQPIPLLWSSEGSM